LPLKSCRGPPKLYEYPGSSFASKGSVSSNNNDTRGGKSVHANNRTDPNSIADILRLEVMSVPKQRADLEGAALWVSPCPGTASFMFDRAKKGCIVGSGEVDDPPVCPGPIKGPE
jgi:hypothetical protein